MPGVFNFYFDSFADRKPYRQAAAVRHCLKGILHQVHYHHFEVGAEVGLLVKPFDIHIMKKERVCNTFEGKLQDATHVEFLGCTFECASVEGLESGTDVKVEVDFDKVILQDNEEDGTLTGEVKFILYKGDHYHLTVWSDWDENVFVDTNDVWDDGDRVGITIPPDAIRVIKITD